MEIKIAQLTTFTPDLTAVINNLLLQLNPDSKALNEGELKKIIENKANRIFVSRENNKIVGMITLSVQDLLSAKKGALEDFVVDENYRGKGIGSKLLNKIIEQAKLEGVKKIDFTSNPKRIEANELYQKMGFQKRDTNVYRIDL